MRRSIQYRPASIGEPLERRDCPAVDIRFFGGTLFVLGDSATNLVQITDDGVGTVQATIDGTSRTETRVRAVVVRTGSGGDNVTYSLTNPLTRFRAITIDTGRDDDVLTFNGAEGVGSRGNLLFTYLGGDGGDIVDATLGGISRRGLATIGLYGQWGDNDAIRANVAGTLNGWLTLSLDGGFGDDVVAGTVDLAGGSTGTLVASVRGSLGDDAVDLFVTGAGASTLRRLYAMIDGGFGTDTCQKTDNVRASRCEA
jgi:hypothetical protein